MAKEVVGGHMGMPIRVQIPTYHASSQPYGCSGTIYTGVSGVPPTVQSVNIDIENCTKEMPMMTGTITGSSSNSTGTYTIPNQMFTPNEIRRQHGLASFPPAEYQQSLQDKIINEYNNKPARKKSKFEFIDKLIEESKERLIGHAQPQFAFKYF